MAQSIDEASVPTLILKEGETDEVGAATASSTYRSVSSSALTVTIRLSAQESSFLETIQNAVQYLQDGRIPDVAAQPVVVRIAGGWVRDKVLGLSTHDVDVTTDTMTGVEFATVVQSYLTLTNQTTRRMGVIAANPNQSKHLETATMIVMGLECDFCNLRAEEVYTNDSRIPTVVMGTPLQDAQRRDFCANALFFNLQTNQVEDWTLRGLNDLLHAKQLVTPLDPFTTFHDDPLRVLRAIRFAIRFDFSLHETLQTAAKTEAIQEALLKKVSRERVGKELEGMLSGKGAQPEKAMQLIGTLNLSHCVFTLPDSQVTIQGDLLGESYGSSSGSSATSTSIVDESISNAWKLSMSFLSHVSALQSSHTPHANATSKLDGRLFALGTALLPFRHLFYMDSKDKRITVVEFMMRESIKFPNKHVTDMVTLMQHVDTYVSFLMQEMHSTAAAAAAGETTTAAAASEMNDVPSTPSRLEIGMLLRATKDLWVTGLFLAAVLVRAPEPNEEATTSSSSLSAPVIMTMTEAAVVAQQLYERIVVDMELDMCWKVRPLLDGRALIQALKLPKGPLVGTYLEEQTKWMLQHPNDGTKELCLEHLRAFQMDSSASVSTGAAAAATTSSKRRMDSTGTEESKRAHVN